MTRVTLKITADRDFELLRYVNSLQNSCMLWELRHNFHRQFEHLPGRDPEFIKGVEFVLEKLRYEIQDYVDDIE